MLINQDCELCLVVDNLLIYIATGNLYILLCTNKFTSCKYLILWCPQLVEKDMQDCYILFS